MHLLLPFLTACFYAYPAYPAHPAPYLSPAPAPSLHPYPSPYASLSPCAYPSPYLNTLPAPSPSLYPAPSPDPSPSLCLGPTPPPLPRQPPAPAPESLPMSTPWNIHGCIAGLPRRCHPAICQGCRRLLGRFRGRDHGSILGWCFWGVWGGGLDRLGCRCLRRSCCGCVLFFVF